MLTLPEKTFYYDAKCGINAAELLDVLQRVPVNEWGKENFRIHSASKSYVSGTYNDITSVVSFTFSDNDKMPLAISGTNKRKMERVASKLSRILKLSKLEKIKEEEII